MSLTLSPQSTYVSPLVGRRYLKMNGIGNQIVVLDLRGSSHIVQPAEARAIARETSVYDQLMVIHDPQLSGTDAFIRIYNNDGSESGACGNGTRCVAWALMNDSLMKIQGKEALTLHTRSGLLPVWQRGEWRFCVDMGIPKLKWHEIPLAEEFRDTRMIELQIGPIDEPVLHSPSVVNMGNPHAIFFVDDVNAYQLEKVGPLLENHPIFPERANISLAHIIDETHIKLKVWERSVGITQACGSGACAAQVAAVRKKLTQRTATVCLPGGELVIEWRESNDHVYMTGDVELEHEGILNEALFADSQSRLPS
jgi:diaminopimelate epimerase